MPSSSKFHSTPDQKPHFTDLCFQPPQASPLQTLKDATLYRASSRDQARSPSRLQPLEGRAMVSEDLSSTLLVSVVLLQPSLHHPLTSTGDWAHLFLSFLAPAAVGARAGRAFCGLLTLQARCTRSSWELGTVGGVSMWPIDL